jgi:histidinol dehydrogenase
MKIYNWNQLSEAEQQKVLQRPSLSTDNSIKEKTQDIINQVILNSDAALKELTARYDRVNLNQLQTSLAEFEEANAQINEFNMAAIKFAYKQINTFHAAQLMQSEVIETYPGIYCERQSRPIARVGLYVPGGTAPLISTLLMLAIPAQIAGCPLKILCTPANSNGKLDPNLLVAAKLCGIEHIFKVGGAQAIAAMAYGTKSIPKVDKIFGPGNSWVTQAKLLVSQDPNGASIDMPAGPSEVMVIADDCANPNYVAADLLSQAEHGKDSQVILICLSQEFALEVQRAIKLQEITLSRREIIDQALLNSRIIVAENIKQAIAINNLYAPEHLILQVMQPEKYIADVQNAGAVFLGPWSAETMGDYVTGSNHVLPTNGYARSYSGLSLSDFMKCISFQTVTLKAIQEIGGFAEKLAEMEGLAAHKQAISLRLKTLTAEISHD